MPQSKRSKRQRSDTRSTNLPKNSGWRVEVTDVAAEAIAGLASKEQSLIYKFLRRLPEYGNPRRIGEALHGDLAGLWKYRVGDYRVICRIEDDRLVVLVIRVGNRREVYR